MKAERIKGLCEIRTALLEVINIQSHEYDPVDLQKVQDTLNQVYDRFVAKYGAINSKGNILAFLMMTNSPCCALSRMSGKTRPVGINQRSSPKPPSVLSVRSTMQTPPRTPFKSA